MVATKSIAGDEHGARASGVGECCRSGEYSRRQSVTRLFGAIAVVFLALAGKSLPSYAGEVVMRIGGHGDTIEVHERIRPRPRAVSTHRPVNSIPLQLRALLAAVIGSEYGRPMFDRRALESTTSVSALKHLD